MTAPPVQFPSTSGPGTHTPQTPPNRYNLYMVKLTCFRDAALYVLTNVLSCVTTTKIEMQNSPTAPKRSLTPLKALSPFPQAQTLGRTDVMLVLIVWLPLAPRLINEILQNVPHRARFSLLACF